MGLLTRGTAWLNERVVAAGKVTITYSRPSTGATATITDAVVGRTPTDMINPNGNAAARVEVQERDYLIPVASLPFGPPAKGDRIVEAGVGTFEVSKRPTEAEWRWSDAERTVYRVHVKQQGP